MIYICIAARNDASTVGLVLWKIRQVFDEFPREYHLLVAEDASTDDTADVLAPYQKALPITVIRHEKRKGYAASLESLFREALARTDRPRRDCVLTVPADFSITPAVLPDLIKRTESGADVVVADAIQDIPSAGLRLVRRLAPWLLQPGLRLSGFGDVMSGLYAIRLITLKKCLQDGKGPLLKTEGACANAELVARAALAARQITVVSIATSPDPATGKRSRPIALAVDLLLTGRRLKIPAPQATVQRA